MPPTTSPLDVLYQVVFRRESQPHYARLECKDGAADALLKRLVRLEIQLGLETIRNPSPFDQARLCQKSAGLSPFMMNHVLSHQGGAERRQQPNV